MATVDYARESSGERERWGEVDELWSASDERLAVVEISGSNLQSGALLPVGLRRPHEEVFGLG
jgi:hypothetical protein